MLYPLDPQRRLKVSINPEIMRSRQTKESTASTSYSKEYFYRPLLTIDIHPLPQRADPRSHDLSPLSGKPSTVQPTCSYLP